MKSYTEELGNELFDWNVELNRPENKIDWDKLVVRADCWTTCACGSQCSVIPRFTSGKPKDSFLSDLGKAFYRSIRDRNVEKSKSILSEIEIRSAFLINEINKSKP